MVLLAPFVFAGGQLTDLPAWAGTPLDGTELFEMVAPGDPATALNYRITSAQLAVLLPALVATAVILENGDNILPGDPYIVPGTVARVYVNKTIAEPTYIRFGPVSAARTDVIIADVAGTAAPTPNLITITFDGAEQASGNATITIENPYGGWSFRPVFNALAGLAKWFLGSA